MKDAAQEAMRDHLARTMEPEAWAEYDAGEGVCSNDAGYKCLASLDHANRVMPMIMAALKATHTDGLNDGRNSEGQ